MRVYETLKDIADVLDRHPNTIRKWIYHHGFPAARCPGGKYITTDQLINQWILARAEVSSAEKESATT